MQKSLKAIFLLIIFAPILSAQDIYFGNDLSYVNQMEDCGAVFKEDNLEKDVYEIFKDHGTNLVRVRLWHNPTWQNGLTQPSGVKSQYSDYDDVYETISRAKAEGMEVMLGFQMSDAWADPGRQVIPQAWLGVAYDLPVLKDSVYNYVIKVLSRLNQDGLLPEIIKIGNENNSGIMKHETMNSNLDPSGDISSDWNRHAQLFNIAIKAVRDFTDTTSIKPKIALHCADPSKTTWWYNNITARGVTDFDIIGFSYYYSWHGSSIPAVGNQIARLRSDHPGYDVMIVETGYLWSNRNYDDMGNIITTPDPRYLPVRPEKQLEYMIDLQRAVIRAGGIGTIFWEPAWVSTPCSTPWGVGSSHDHVVFFDPVYTNFMEDGGGRWMESKYYENINAPKVTFEVNMSGQNTSRGVFIKGTWSDSYQEMLKINDSIYSLAVYRIDPNTSGGFYFLNGDTEEFRETISENCTLWESVDRKYTVTENDTTISKIFSVCENDPSNTISPNDLNNHVEIFPNPAREAVTLKLADNHDFTHLQIIDICGSLLEQTTLSNNEGSKVLDISPLKPGIYFLQIESENVLINQKLLVR